MSYPDFPANVKTMAASTQMRWRHRYWHLVKNEGFVKNPANIDIVQALADIGWTAALTGEPGSGLDFLYMHRQMIHHVDMMLSNANDPNWGKVEGWSNIPAMPDDPDWPEPQIPNIDNPTAWPENIRDTIEAIAGARSAEALTTNMGYATTLRDPAFLTRPDITLDKYGELIEITVHNWMHMRFAASPPADFEDESTANDWLGAPFSSHVNKYFWKLHGWIDDCIGLWEIENEKQADFSSAWRAPEEAPPWDDLLPTPAAEMAIKKSKAPLFGPLQPFAASPSAIKSAQQVIESHKK